MHKTMRDSAVDVLLVDGVVMNKRVEGALRMVPRHPFAPRFSIRNQDGSYSAYTQLGHGREGDDDRAAALAQLYSPSARPVISFADDGAPMVTMDTMRDVARLLELAQVAQGRGVLEIGTGTGYTAALLARLTGLAPKVTSIETDSFACRAAPQRFPDDEAKPRFIHDDGRDGDSEGAPYAVVLSWCDVPRVPASWVRLCSHYGRVVTTMAGQPIVLERVSDFADQFEVAGKFSAGEAVLGTSPLRPHLQGRGSSVASQLAELAQLSARGGTRSSSYVPPGRLEHPTVQWLLRLVHPELRFEVHQNHYRILDPHTMSWVNAYPPALNSGGYIQTGGIRKTLWDQVMQVFNLWVNAHRPQCEAFGLTVTESGDHTLWLEQPSNVLMPLVPVRS